MTDTNQQPEPNLDEAWHAMAEAFKPIAAAVGTVWEAIKPILAAAAHDADAHAAAENALSAMWGTADGYEAREHLRPLDADQLKAVEYAAAAVAVAASELRSDKEEATAAEVA
jgi:hypothetical protein